MKGYTRDEIISLLTPDYKNVEDLSQVSAVLKLCNSSFEVLWSRAKCIATQLQEEEKIETIKGAWEDFVTKDFLDKYTAKLRLYQNLQSDDEPSYYDEVVACASPVAIENLDSWYKSMGMPWRVNEMSPNDREIEYEITRERDPYWGKYFDYFESLNKHPIYRITMNGPIPPHHSLSGYVQNNVCYSNKST